MKLLWVNWVCWPNGVEDRPTFSTVVGFLSGDVCEGLPGHATNETKQTFLKQNSVCCSRSSQKRKLSACGKRTPGPEIKTIGNSLYDVYYFIKGSHKKTWAGGALTSLFVLWNTKGRSFRSFVWGKFELCSKKGGSCMQLHFQGKFDFLTQGKSDW